jgi:hypothetical protein
LLALETELELKVLAFAVDEAVDLLKQAGNTILSMILANILSDLPYNKDIFKPPTAKLAYQISLTLK